MGSFLSKLGLPENTSVAVRHTRFNGECLKVDICNQEVGHGSCEQGLRLQRELSGDFSLTTYLVEDVQHVISSRCIVTREGEVRNGKVNLFAVGFADIDQVYLDSMLMEFEAHPVQWDEVDGVPVNSSKGVKRSKPFPDDQNV